MASDVACLLSGAEQALGVGMTSHPKLIYLASSFPYGKNDTFFGPEVRELVRQGVDLLAIPVRPRGDLTTADAAPITLRKPLLDLEIAWAVITETLRSPGAVASALALLRRQPNPPVLLRNLVSFPKALWVAKLARRWRADHIHAHWAGPPSTVALIASRVSGVPWSFTAHFADIAANNLLREKCGSALFVRFISRAMMELARRTAPAIDESRWVLLRLGVEVPPPPVARNGLNRPPVLLMPARFDVEKRHRTLIDATFELVQGGLELEVWLAGTGPLEADVARQVIERSLHNVVRLLGYVPNAQVLEWLAAGRVDVVVLPSDAEGVPVSLIEALAHGVSAVACDAGGVAELLGDGCGEIVPPGESHELAAAVARVLASPELRAERAKAGRARVEDEFAVAPVVHRLRELLGFSDQDAG
jgi:colanic acid/amylovoran biosynthesis glycosyltransferase